MRQKLFILSETFFRYLPGLLTTIIMIIPSQGLKGQSAYLEKMSSEVRTYELKTVFSGFAEAAPLLDGKLDDECWKQADVYSDFKTTRNRHMADWEAPRKEDENKTRFYVLNDERFIYIGIECFEEDMDGLRTVAFLHDDRNNIMGDDRVEVLLDLEHNHQNAINLVLSAGGATFDQMLRRPIQYALSAIYEPEWNGKWHSKVYHMKDRWTAEIFIDVNHEMRSPINKGQTFGLMVGRARSDRSGSLTRKHWAIGKTSWNNPKEDHDTTWKEKNTFDYEIWAHYTAFPEVRDWTHNGASGFYEPIQYADLVCGDPKVRVSSIGFNEAFANYSGSIWQKPQFWGENPLELTLHNQAGKALDLEISVTTGGFRGDSLVDIGQVTLEEGKTLKVNNRIRIREDSFQPFLVSIADKETGQHLYNTTYVTRVPPFIEFDLEAIYQPPGMDSKIKYIPVIVPDGFDGLTATLALYSREDKKLLAEDRIENFEKVNEFTPCLTGLDIDAMATGNYYIDCRLMDDEGKLVGEFDQIFTRRSYEGERSFGARKDMWAYGGISEEAVIVEYPDQKDFVLWKPANYFGMWFLNNVGLTYECAECWGYASGSCNEPMQDKKFLYQNAEIIENTPARVVVRWTYALTNNNYDIFFNEWVEEYFTLFPDGNGIRKIVVWVNTDLPHEIIQPQYIIPNGILPGQILEEVVTRVFDLDGNQKENLLGSTGGEMNYSVDWSEEILRMPLKNREDPFMIIGKTDQLMPDLRLSNLLYQSADSRDIRYNLGAHWPINKLEVDVFNIVSTDMPYHSWIGLSQVQADDSTGPNVWTHFFGVTDKGDEYIKDIAASWLHPGAVEVTKGDYKFAGFNSVEHAYSFIPRSVNPSALTFSLAPSKRDKIINPFIILHDFEGSDNIDILVNGKKLSTTEYSYGLVPRRSSRDLQIFLNREVTGKTVIQVR